MSLETPVVTLFFLHTGKLFIIGAALGKHKKRERERGGIMLLMIETADKSIGVGAGGGKKSLQYVGRLRHCLIPISEYNIQTSFQ